MKLCLKYEGRGMTAAFLLHISYFLHLTSVLAIYNFYRCYFGFNNKLNYHKV